MPIEKIVADTKVSHEAIELYKQKIKNGEKIAPLIVVKHPRLDLYAVLDGHHRYYTLLEMGKKMVDCAFAGDFSSVIFYLTEHGFFQPNPETKRRNAKTSTTAARKHSGLSSKFSKRPRQNEKAQKRNPTRSLTQTLDFVNLFIWESTIF